MTNFMMFHNNYLTKLKRNSNSILSFIMLKSSIIGIRFNDYRLYDYLYDIFESILCLFDIE